MKKQRRYPLRHSAERLYSFVAKSEHGASRKEILAYFDWTEAKFDLVVRCYRDELESEGYDRILVSTMGSKARWYVVPIRILFDPDELMKFETWAGARITRMSNERTRLCRTLATAKRLGVDVSAHEQRLGITPAEEMAEEEAA